MRPLDDLPDGRRTRTHARTLAGRIYLTGGSLLLVRGTADARKLLDRLTTLMVCPATPPTPHDLGFDRSDVNPLSVGGLNTRGRSVRRWRTSVENELSGRVTPARRRQLAESMAELDDLSARVSDLHRLLAEPPSPANPFWLSDSGEAELAEVTRGVVAERVVSPDVAWLARLVFWLNGSATAERFLATVRDALCFPAEQADRDAVRRFRELVRPVVDGLGSLKMEPWDEYVAAEAEMRRKIEAAVVPRLRRALDALPDSARGPNRIVMPTRTGEIDFKLLLDRSDAVLADYPPDPAFAALAGLAAVYLTDNATIALPWAVADRHLHNSWLVDKLFDQSAKPGYGELLAYLSVAADRDWPSCDGARRLLASGHSPEAVDWWRTHLEERLDDDAEPRALPAVRAVVEWLTAHGSEGGSGLGGVAAEFWRSAATPAGRVVAESLARFVRWLAAPTGQQAGEVAGLVRLLSIRAFGRRLVERLRRWGDPPPRTKLPEECPGGLPADLAALLRRLAFHQKMAGEVVRLPKSLRKPLDAAARTEREREHLRSLGESLDARQAARLRHLDARAVAGTAADDAAAVGKLVRQAREVAALAALTAAKAVLRDELTAWWRDRFRCDPDLDSVRWPHLYQLVTWADGLADADRRLVDGIVSAHREHGTGYRRHLPHNAGWLAHAVTAMDLDGWLDPPPAVRRTLPDGRSITVAAAADPRDVFLMGTRFNTCLSLDNGVNRAAVLANAADANKAVAYAFDAAGEPVARKLVGVTPDGRLVGFRVYCNAQPSDPFGSAIEEYCAAWAGRIGLPLTDGGVPAALTGGFWYDDGAEAWSEAARVTHATAEAARRADGRPVPVARPLLARLHDAVRADGPAPLDALADASLGQPWHTAVAFWQLVRFPERPVRVWQGVNRPLLYAHLAARGLVPTGTDPRRWDPGPDTGSRDDDPARLWGEVAYTLPWLPPPDPAALRAGANLLLSLTYRPGDHHNCCFATCFVTPLLGTLPFDTVVRLLGRYAGWFTARNCGCNYDSRPEWARVVRAAWRRDGDNRALARLATDPSAIVRDVAREVFRLEPVAELGRALERRRKAAPPAEADAIRDLSVEPRPSRDPLADLATDPERPFAERLAAAERLFAEPNEVDVRVGAELCAAWTADERERLHHALRRRVAEALVGECAFERCWRLWPALYWAGTLPADEQPGLFLDPKTGRLWDEYRHQLQHLDWGGDPPPQLAILVQALDHPLPGVRQAIRSLVAAAGPLDAAWAERYARCAGPFAHPDNDAAEDDIATAR